MSRHPEKIVFIIPYPISEAPSQRFRFEQYLPHLKEYPFKITLLPFLYQSGWKLLYSSSYFRKSIQLLAALSRRPFDLFRVMPASFVFIHREALPFGPPVFEWFLAKVLKKKIIYDFDDAIWLTDKKSESFLERTLRWRSKVASICKWSYKVSCGNNYLRNYAHQFNHNSILNPTTIDTENLHNPAWYRIQKDQSKIILGWTGSHSTLKYLNLLQGVLEQIQQRFTHVDLLVIADVEPTMTLNRIIYKRWSKDTEIKDLLMVDIGIMPLPNDEWSKGKCGFKALQYMALEIPAVISPVGVNKDIVQHEANGYLCSSPEEWLLVLEKLIANPSLRKQIGEAGRRTVVNHYSVSSNANNFLSLFQ